MAIFTADWDETTCEALSTRRGESAFLTFWEALVVLACLHVWCCCPDGAHSIAVVGDNTAALSVAISQRGRGNLGKICREIALRQARWSLEVAVGHLPSEWNTWADALSRLSAPCPAEMPEELAAVPRRGMPALADLFRIEPPL